MEDKLLIKPPFGLKYLISKNYYKSLITRAALTASKPELLRTALTAARTDTLRTALTEADIPLLAVAVTKVRQIKPPFQNMNDIGHDPLIYLYC